MCRSVYLAIMLVGCGDNAAALDAAGDADTSHVTLTATKDGAPMVGVNVYFQNADSSLVLATTTDATGTARALIVPGGYVTALDPYGAPGPGSPDLVKTFAGVRPGDHLSLDQNNPPSVKLAITAPADPSGNANAYRFVSTCGGTSLNAPGGTAGVATGSAILPCSGVADVMVVTETGAGDPLSYIYRPSVAMTDPVRIAFAAPYAPAVPRTYTIDGHPDAQQSISIRDTVATDRGPLYQQLLFGVGDPAVMSSTMPAFVGATDIVAVRETPSSQVGGRNVIAWDAFSAAFTLDFAGNLVPDCTAPTYDAAAHALSWTEASGAQQPDLTLVDLSVIRSADHRAWTWSIVAPHTGTTLAFPQLPNLRLQCRRGRGLHGDVRDREGPGRVRRGTCDGVDGRGARGARRRAVGRDVVLRSRATLTGSAPEHQHALAVQLNARGDWSAVERPRSRASTHP